MLGLWQLSIEGKSIPNEWNMPIRTTVKRLLDRVGLTLTRHRPGAITGIDLFRDLRVLIPQETPVCLDVGANTGQTIKALQRSLRNPCIHAFEPSTSTFKVLQGQKHADNIFLHNYALGAKNGEAESINSESSVLSSFLPVAGNVDNRFRTTAEKSREMAGIVTVDSFVSGHGLNEVDLLKSDTQGYDYQVLLGAQETLRRGKISFVLIELNFVRLYSGHATPVEIIEFLKMHELHLIDYYEIVRRSSTIAWCTALFGRR